MTMVRVLLEVLGVRRLAHPRAAGLAFPPLGETRRLREARTRPIPGNQRRGRRDRRAPYVARVARRPTLLRQGLPQASLRLRIRIRRLSGPYTTPNTSVVRSFIEAVAKAAHEEHQAVGSGRDVRFEDDGISGYRLISERGLEHAVAFAG